jgi:hypothetical protein
VCVLLPLYLVYSSKVSVCIFTISEKVEKIWGVKYFIGSSDLLQFWTELDVPSKKHVLPSQRQRET